MTTRYEVSRGPIRRISIILLAVLLVLYLAPTPCFAQADGDDVIIGTYRQVPSRILGAERRILIHLPRGYEESGRSFPVIYKLHGAPLSFFAPISSSLDLLAESGRIPRAILVGVEQHGHGEVRPRDAGGPALDIRAEEFLRFLIEELLPFVDRNYRTKDLRILMGTYDCALFTIYTLLEAPESFNAYLANSLRDIGPGPGAETVFSRAETRLAEGFEGPRFLYITEWRDPQGGTDPLVDGFLVRLGTSAPSGLTWGSQFLEHPSHDTWIPYKAVEHGLLGLFEGYKCPHQALEQGLRGVEAHYATMSRRFEVHFEIPEMAFNNLSDYLIERQRWEEAIEALLLFQKAYPRSLNAVFRLARAYRGAGDFDHAVESYRAALEFENCPPFLGEEMRRLESSPAFAVERSIVESGLEAGLARFRAIRSEGQEEHDFREGEFNDVGYRLLSKGMVVAAVAVFGLNVEMFPESSNAYDSLGEAYAASGDTTMAIANYRKSLVLDSENGNAREMLRRLGAPE